jgi:hypothetical protein
MTVSALKIGAIVSALALGSLYITIQQRKGTAQAEKPGPADTPAEKEIVLLPGSKSAGGEFEFPLPNQQAPKEDPPLVVMPGSKSFVMPLFSTRKTEDPPDGLPQVLMSSSKSGAIDIDPEQLQQILKQIEQTTVPESETDDQE